MANSDKDIKIIPNTNQGDFPKIEFIGSSSAPIVLSVLDDNSLSFSGSEGQLFSISNNLTTGIIFSVNNVSGLPILEASASGDMYFGEFGGKFGIGTTNPTHELTVVGTISASNYLGITGGGSGDVTAAGNNTFTGINSFTTMSVGVVSSSLIPSDNEVWDLGSPTNRWRDLYLSSSTIYLGDKPLSVVEGQLSFDNSSIGIGTDLKVKYYPSSVDPYYDNVSLLLNFNGINGSTIFTDSSANALAITRVGDAQISTTQSKFGGSSGYFDGDGDRLSWSGTSGGFTFDGDFTVEMWIYPLLLNSTLLEIGTYTNGLMIRPSDNRIYVNNTQMTCPTLDLNAWTHLALVRNGSTVSFYKNGLLASDMTKTGVVNSTSGSSFLADSTHSPGRYFTGYIDDLRITKGVARYTANFTPPTVQLPSMGGALQERVAIISDLDDVDTLTVPPTNGQVLVYSTASNNWQPGTVEAGDVTAAGNNTFTGINSFTTMSVGVVSSSLIPSDNEVWDLGSPTNRWRDLYLSSSTIYLGDKPLSVANGNLTLDGTPIVSGVTTLSNATANSIYQTPTNQLNTAWTNLETNLGSPTWFSASATQEKRTQFMEAVGTTTAFNRNLFDKNRVTIPSGTYPGSNAFVGGVLLPDGRVFCIPLSSTTARIYDPATDTLTTPSGTYPGSSAFIGGVLLPDGRVFCIPFSSTTARIYDPATDTVITPNGTYPGSSAFAAGVLLPDGRVFCVPNNSTTARIYDPATDTVITPSGTYPGSNAFVGGVLLPDGRVFCVPNNSTTAHIYDPATDTLTTPSGTYPGSSAFIGGVLLPDGRVFCIPFSSTTARIYDPATDTVTTPNGTYPGSNAYQVGVLLPDGRVFCVPFDSTTARIYDPATDTVITPSGTYPGSNAYQGAVLLPDGRVFCVPRNSTTALIYESRTTTMPDTITMSPFYNKF